MGNGMNKVLPSLYVGNYQDSKDVEQLKRFEITHILAIRDIPRRSYTDKYYLCILASDSPDQNLSQYFSLCNDFIHAARLCGGNVLIHCLAGMSRSVTVAVAYIMSVTDLSWKEALKVVRVARSIANPNIGFRIQLKDFEANRLQEERRRLRERFPSLVLAKSDAEACTSILRYYETLALVRKMFEGKCAMGHTCPTCQQVIRIDRSIGNPYLGFQQQLGQNTAASTPDVGPIIRAALVNFAQISQQKDFEASRLQEERRRLKERFANLALTELDAEAYSSLRNYETLAFDREVCEGKCVMGRTCPTGFCQQAFIRTARRKSSTSSVESVTGSTPSQTSWMWKLSSAPSSPTLYRSAGIVSTSKSKSRPAGLHFYSGGSAPSSRIASRVDLSAAVVCSSSNANISVVADRPSGFSSSSWRLTADSAPNTPRLTPPISPQRWPRQHSKIFL